MHSCSFPFAARFSAAAAHGLSRSASRLVAHRYLEGRGVPSLFSWELDNRPLAVVVAAAASAATPAPAHAPPLRPPLPFLFFFFSPPLVPPPPSLCRLVALLESQSGSISRRPTDKAFCSCASCPTLIRPSYGSSSGGVGGEFDESCGFPSSSFLASLLSLSRLLFSSIFLCSLS